uniref:Uncharacterized protein n=1 Tax=Myripristis murdjan TaxID=586833 RepID=A0A668ASN0_9TELE
AVHPLHLAASYRRVRSMKSLLTAGADPDMRDRQGRTTLHLIITSWPHVQSTKAHSKLRTSASSLQQRAEACLHVLCDHGANVNAEVDGEDHQTALHLCVRYAIPPAIQMLANYGAEINVMDRKGMTPLHMASGMLDTDTTACLIRHGANVNMVSLHSGNTPLHLAALAATTRNRKTLENDFSCLSELLEHGANPDAVNNAGMTPLHEACSSGNEALVDLLLSYGADINKRTKAGENCLFLILDHKSNMRHRSLLDKVLSLTSPLIVYNRKGLLPATLMLPQFIKLGLELLNLARQPRKLKDICKIQIYLKYSRGKTEELRQILPKKLYDFVFNNWENTNSVFSVKCGLPPLPWH